MVGVLEIPLCVLQDAVHNSFLLLTFELNSQSNYTPPFRASKAPC